MTTETIDKLFLELSQVTQATTAKEIELRNMLDTERELRRVSESNLTALYKWVSGVGDGWPLSGTALDIRKVIEEDYN